MAMVLLDQSSIRSNFDRGGRLVFQASEEKKYWFNLETKDTRDRSCGCSVSHLRDCMSPVSIAVGWHYLPMEELKGLGLYSWIWALDYNLHSTAIPSW